MWIIILVITLYVYAKILINKSKQLNYNQSDKL